MTHDDDSRKVALILAQLKPREGVKLGFGEPAEDAEDSLEAQLEDVAAELVAAVKAGDTRAVAESLKAAFLVCDASPHVEGEHIGEDEDEDAAHEMMERLGGHAYGGKARARYADGGTVGVPPEEGSAAERGIFSRAAVKSALDTQEKLNALRKKEAMGLLDRGVLEAADSALTGGAIQGAMKRAGVTGGDVLRAADNALLGGAGQGIQAYLKKKNDAGRGALDEGAVRMQEAADMMKLKKEMALGALDEGAMRTLEAERKRRKLADALLERK